MMPWTAVYFWDSKQPQHHLQQWLIYNFERWNVFLLILVFYSFRKAVLENLFTYLLTFSKSLFLLLSLERRICSRPHKADALHPPLTFLKFPRSEPPVTHVFSFWSSWLHVVTHFILGLYGRKQWDRAQNTCNLDFNLVFAMFLK